MLIVSYVFISCLQSYQFTRQWKIHCNLLNKMYSFVVYSVINMPMCLIEYYVMETYCGRSPRSFDPCLMNEIVKVYVSTALYQKEGLSVHNGQKTGNICRPRILKEKIFTCLEQWQSPQPDTILTEVLNMMFLFYFYQFEVQQSLLIEEQCFQICYCLCEQAEAVVIVLDVGERIQKYSYFLQVEVNLSLCLVRHHTLNCSGGVEMYLYTPNLTEVSDQVHASVTLLPGAFSWQSLVNRLYIPKSVWKIRRRRFPVTGNEGSERGRSVGLLSLL